MTVAIYITLAILGTAAGVWWGARTKKKTLKMDPLSKVVDKMETPMSYIKDFGYKRASRLFSIAIYLQRAQTRGLRIKTIRPIHRGQGFTIPPGATGELLEGLSDPEDNRYVIRVRLDRPVPPSADLGLVVDLKEIHWKEDVNLDEFEKDVAFYKPAG